MSLHLYEIGNSVLFTEESKYVNRAKGAYAISRLLPEDDATGEPQYRLKSRLEGHERRAKESDLELFQPTPQLYRSFETGALGQWENDGGATAQLDSEKGSPMPMATAPMRSLGAE